MERVDVVVTPVNLSRLARDVAWLWQTGVQTVGVQLDGELDRELLRSEMVAVGRERLRWRLAGCEVGVDSEDPRLRPLIRAVDATVAAALAAPPVERPISLRRMLAVALILVGLNAVATGIALQLRGEHPYCGQHHDP